MIKYLSDIKELADSILFIERAGLSHHHDPYKDWDLSILVELVKSNFKELDHQRMICGDIGSGKRAAGCRLLRELLGNDAVIKAVDLQGGLNEVERELQIKVEKRDFLNTGWDSNSFDLLISLSVIEHGIDLNELCKEVSRLLKPGGKFLFTTDYWHEELNTMHLYPYGKEQPPMKVFSPSSIMKFTDVLARYNLLVDANTMASEKKLDPIVHWARMGKSYTFAAVIGTKGSQ